MNYFGKCDDLTNINIEPLLFQKGETKLALYGMSYIHDSRLIRLFNDSKVTLYQPEDPESFFNLMVVHQNRADRGPKNYLPEEVLPEFLDLVLWGHEHDCRIEPEQNATKQFHVTQPGSSVATSLAEGEAKEKFCGILRIRKKDFKLEPIKLKTVRPFVFKSIDLKDYEEEIEAGDEDVGQNVMTFVKRQVDEMLVEAKTQLTNHPKQPTLPLIRLRVVYHSEAHVFNHIRFGQQYQDVVANPKDMILFKKLKKRNRQDPVNFDKGKFNQITADLEEDQNEMRVEDIVGRYFEGVESSKQLKIFSVESMAEVCRQLVQHDDEDAVKMIIDYHKEKLCSHLNEVNPEEKNIQDEIKTFQDTKSNDLVKPLQEVCFFIQFFNVLLT